MNPTISGIFVKKEDAQDAVNELAVLGVDKVEVREVDNKTVIDVDFSEVTGVRNVFEKRNAVEIREILGNRDEAQKTQ